MGKARGEDAEGLAVERKTSEGGRGVSKQLRVSYKCDGCNIL